MTDPHDDADASPVPDADHPEAADDAASDSGERETDAYEPL